MSAPQAPFVLTLQDPKRGWLPFRIEFADVCVEDSASFVVNDPITSLLDLLRYALTATPESWAAGACLWLEPDGYTLDARTPTNPNAVIVRLQYYRNMLPPDHAWDDHTVWRTQTTHALLGAALFEPLSALLATPSADLVRVRGADTVEAYLRAFHACQMLMTE